MTKNEIIALLESSHNEFISFYDSLSEKEFKCRPNGKWSVGQHSDHILRSISPLSSGIRMFPKFVIKIKFGKISRPLMSYQDVVSKYQQALSNGAEASGDFVPIDVPFAMKEEILESIDTELNHLCNGLGNYSENELDEISLPHPILGAISFREMLFFTSYHVKHHMKIAKSMLENCAKSVLPNID